MKQNEISIILDSGAFSAWSKGAVIDIDKYIDFIKKNDGLFDHVINLDVIGNAAASYKNWKYIRSKGIDVMPVYHLGTHDRYLKRYLQETDHIAIGAVANMNTAQRNLGLSRVWRDYLTDEKGMPKFKVHGLGLTTISFILRYPWYSVDSASVRMSAAFGGIFLPNLKYGVDKPDYQDMNPYIVSDQGGHSVGKTKSFLSFTPTVKKRYKEFIEQNGFLLGDSEYKKKRPKRRKYLDKEVMPGFDLVQEEETTTKNEILTLANSMIYRAKWNRLMWHEFVERLPAWNRPMTDIPVSMSSEPNSEDSTKMYTIESHKPYIKSILENPIIGLLVSYYYMTENVIKIIKEKRL